MLRPYAIITPAYANFEKLKTFYVYDYSILILEALFLNYHVRMNFTCCYMDSRKERMLLNSSNTEYMLLFDFTSAWIPICNMSFKLSLREYEI